jgi:DNA-binding Lrp family transcriptional regulator
VSLADVAEKLGIDKSSASRRVKQAIKLGYLVNEEPIKGNPLRLYLGEPLPEEVQVLPRPEELQIKEEDPPAVYGLDD